MIFADAGLSDLEPFHYNGVDYLLLARDTTPG